MDAARRILIALFIVVSFATAAHAQNDLWATFKQNAQNVNLPGVTEIWRDQQTRLGWCDELLYLEWRIQKQVDKNEHRLIDPLDKIVKTGTFDECRDALNKIRAEKKLPKQDGTVILVIHGLGELHLPNQIMADSLRKADKWHVLNWRYSSRHATIAEHAASLHQVLKNLDEADTIHIVAHSMGNLVVRHYWKDQTDEAKGLKPDPRIKRMVMVGPPNQGAQMARLFSFTPKLVEKVTGSSALQLATEWKQLEPKLATPTCEFGIIAGGKGDDDGFNPLLSGDDDTLVCVRETRLPGAKAYVCLPVLHQFQMADATIQNATVTFLHEGKFPAIENAISTEMPK
jgi:pimeloyl-ACP methyl ester carboxylesterase